MRLFSRVHLTFLWFPLAQSVGLHFCGSRTAQWPCHVEPCPASLGCCASINCSATKEGPGSTGLFKKWWRGRQLEQESKWESRQIQEQDKEDWDCRACLTMCLHSAYEISRAPSSLKWNALLMYAVCICCLCSEKLRNGQETKWLPTRCRDENEARAETQTSRDQEP